MKENRHLKTLSRLHAWWSGYRWQSLVTIWAVFLLMAAVLFAERSGVRYTVPKFKLNYLDSSEAIPAETAMFGQPVTCLLLYDSSQDGVDQAKEQFDRILLDMKVSTQSLDVADSRSGSALPELSQYRTVVVLMPNLDVLGEGVIELMDWVEDGGGALFAMTPVKTDYFDVIAPKLGILASTWEFKVAESIVPKASFMLGGGQRYEFSDPFESSLSVNLREDTEVFASTGDENIPLIWRNHVGEGSVVVCNMGIYARVVRGFYASAYSLIEDACAWPVINSATFYLDDFPSPVPGGDGTYVRRDYGMSIGDFYSKVWWPDVIQLGQKYGIRYTGVMIENYEDNTQSEPTRQSDTEQFRYYGGMLLRYGGELGYHGYNHQPLCLPNVDYRDEYGYNTWPTAAAIVASLQELIGFQRDILPNAYTSVYVPPSKILSAEGRELLGSEVTQIRTIASTYFEDGTEYPYVQEFGVAADGIVEQPRIISGGLINDYMYLAAVSELNMHFVSTHFMHPDDLLDEDRGAAEGWEKYKAGLEGYMKWLTDAVPSIEIRTGTECSAAIQRYSGLTVDIETSESEWTLTLGNFVDEGWLLFRANGGTPGRVTGGSLTHLTGDLYLLEAKSATVRIERKGAER